MDGSGESGSFPPVQFPEPDDYDDPDPVSEIATVYEKRSYASTVDAYSKEMLDCFENSSFKGQDLWIEFKTTFREQTVKTLSSSSTIKWIDLLRKRGVNVKRGRNIRRVKALCDCLLLSLIHI